MDDLHNLLFGDPRHLAEYLDVDVRTVRRWQAGKTPPPPIIKLLRMRLGDISGLLGANWEGFHFGRDGLLYHPFYKYGFSAAEIRGMFFEVKEIAWHRKETARMKAELHRLTTELWALKKVRAIGFATSLDT